MEKVGVVVVTYNRLSLLKEEIESLNKQTYRNFQIIVVNNGSTDDTESWLLSQENIITITQANVGGAGGFYTGIKYAVEHGFSMCWIMDDDVEYKENSLEELVRSYKLMNGHVGFVCSKVEGVNGAPMNVPVVDDRPTGNGYPYYYDMVSEQMIKVKQATFVSLFFDSDVVRKVGLPLKEFFIWHDDSEYTMRISRCYPCYLCCKSIAIHKRKDQSPLNFKTESDPKRLENFFYFFRNKLYITRKYDSEKKYWFSIAFLFLRMVKNILFLNINKSKVFYKTLVALPSFSPQVEFPKFSHEE